MALDLVWIWYLGTAAAAAVLFGWASPEGRPLLYAAILLSLLGVVLAMRWGLAHRSPFAQRFARGALTLLGIPVVFSSMGLVLPAIHPEPCEWAWIAWD